MAFDVTSSAQSVVMTVHNAAEWIEQSLHSVLSQTFTGKMELSLFNDASTVSHTPSCMPRGHTCSFRNRYIAHTQTSPTHFKPT